MLQDLLDHVHKDKAVRTLNRSFEILNSAIGDYFSVIAVNIRTGISLKKITFWLH